MVASLAKKQRRLANLFDQPDRPPVEGNEDVAAELVSLVGDDAIGEVTAQIQNGETGFDGRPVDDNVRDLDQASDSRGDLFVPNSVAPIQHPGQLAKRRHRDRH